MKGTKIPYTSEELTWLKDNCTLVIGDYHQQFCQKFERTDVNQTNLNALRKRKGWRTGRTGHFTKGQTSWNKGMKGKYTVKPNEGQFKKGNRPHNWKPVGHERINVDGYREVKTAEPRTFELKHRLVWKEHNGEIPENHIVTFIDGDRPRS